MDKILYIDDEVTNLDVFEGTFSEYFDVLIANNTLHATTILKQNKIKVVITDQRMPSETGIEFIEKIKDDYPDIVFMILSGFADFEVTTKAIESGRIYRFLLKPWKEEHLKIDIDNAIERYNILYNNKKLNEQLEHQNKELLELKKLLEEENSYLKTEIKTLKNFENIISNDTNFLKVLEEIEHVAVSDASILITGETGTGKELIARAIHNLSSRQKKPFIAVNCASIPDSLFESELFGYEKGAFTGAISSKKGKFEIANNGTLFLDEVGEIPIALQSKLLRVLQEGRIEHLGSNTPINLNVRFIFATNRNLENDIKNNKFRSDLYYRINVIPVHLPPLRERLGDIQLLVNYFIKKFSLKYNKKIKTITKQTISKLKAYSWPGNIRELENIIERAVITCSNGKIEIDNLTKSNTGNNNSTIVRLEDIERNHIIKILEQTSWKVSGEGGAAEILDINRSTLVSRMRKLNIKKPS